jgi:hypothetical protein
MRVRLSGPLRLWVVFSLLWLAVIGAYIIVSYQNVALRDLKNENIPAYDLCWDYRTNDGRKVDRSSFSGEALVQVAELRERH